MDEENTKQEPPATDDKPDEVAADQSPAEATETQGTKEEVKEETPKLEPDSAEPSEEPDAPTEEPEEPPPSRRESKRIEQLTKKLAEVQRSNEQPKSESQKLIDGEGDYDIDDINQRAETYAAQRYSEGLAQANAITFNTRLEIDAPRVAQKYEILDQNSDKFDPGTAALINEEYLRIVGYDPQTGTVQRNDIRYLEYVDAQFDKAERLNAIRAADSQKNLAKQAAQTGVRPSGVTKSYQGDDPKKMTDEQLDSAIKANLGI